MIIKKVHVNNQRAFSDVQIEDGKFVNIAEHIQPRGGEEVIDGHGMLLLPPLVEPHIHLDTQLTAGQPRWNESGTLFEGIQIWNDRRQQLTKEDVKKRAKAVIKLLVTHGVQFIRSHVDVSDPQLTALQALLELKEEVRDQVTIQLISFPQNGIISNPQGKELMEQAIKDGADAVGGIPHMEFTTETGWQSVHYLMNLAEKYDRLVDVHCDEIDDPTSQNVEVMAVDALKLGIGNGVTASHTTAMGSYNNAYASKLITLLANSASSR